MLRFSLGSEQRRPSPRRTAVLFAIVMSVFGFTTGCESLDADRDQVIDLVNESRAAVGLKGVRENPVLDLKADRWAQRLRDRCHLEHSKLSDGAPREWEKLGENVGYGGSIGQIHDAYLNSPGHRANILDPAFSSVGAAAVWGTCHGQRRMFTVQVFMKS